MTHRPLVPGSVAERYRLPLTVAATAAARPLLLPALDDAGRASLLTLDPSAGSPDGMSVLVLAAADLQSGPGRVALLSIVQSTASRPVMLGGTGDRDLLLDAINAFRVFAVVPLDAPPAVALAAVQSAHEAVVSEHALTCAAGDLRAENERLSIAVQKLRTARERLLHLERLHTLSRIMDGLIRAMGGFQIRFDEIEHDLRAVTAEPEVEEMLAEAFEGLRSIAVLLDEFAAYADSREPSYVFHPEHLDSLVGRVLTFCRFDRLATERQITVRLDSSATVQADRHRLYQVLLNLVRNACQATSRGGRVELRTKTEGDWAIVEVEDDGPGVDPEVAARVFDPFVTTRGADGTGLGLTLCRALVARHGGMLDFTSHPGVGACFRVRLPLSRSGG